MATINISINDTGFQQDVTAQPKSVDAEVLAPTSGGSAPGNDDSSSQVSSEASASVSGNGLVDIGSPPAWLHEAIAADKATLASDSELNSRNTDGGAGPID